MGGRGAPRVTSAFYSVKLCISDFVLKTQFQRLRKLECFLKNIINIEKNVIVQLSLAFYDISFLGSVYTEPDPFGTSTKLVRISLVFTWDLVDPVRIGSAIWHQMGPLMKVISYGTVPFLFQTGPV